jgi:hypothetical protein
MLVGYARVSTDEETLNLQNDALRLIGYHQISPIPPVAQSATDQDWMMACTLFALVTRCRVVLYLLVYYLGLAKTRQGKSCGPVSSQSNRET